MQYPINSRFISLVFQIIFPLMLSYITWQSIQLFYPLPKTNVVEEKKQTLGQIILLREIFEIQNIQKNITQTNQPQISNTSINELTLKAIYHDEKNSFIMINFKGKVEFLALNQIFQGFELVKLSSNTAVLQKNGKQNTLFLQPEDIVQGEQKKTTQADKQIVETSVSRAELTQYQKDLDSIWRNIRLQPIKDNNQVSSYRLSYVRNNSLFDRLGLQKGDNIKSINSILVSDTVKIIQLYTTLDTLNSIHLIIERNNELKDIYYAIN